MIHLRPTVLGRVDSGQTTPFVTYFEVPLRVYEKILRLEISINEIQVM